MGEAKAVKQNDWVSKRERSQEKCFFWYSSIIPAVELQAGTDSKNFPLRSSGKKKSWRKGKCNRIEVAAEPDVVLLALAKKKIGAF